MDSTEYFVLYCVSGVVRRVSKKVFSKIDAPVTVIGDRKFRLVGCLSRRDMRKVLLPFYAEGFVDQIRQFKDGIDVVVTALVTLGTFKEKLSKRNMAVLVKMFLELKTLCEGGFTVTNFINLLLSAYLVNDAFVGESFDAAALLMMGAVLPAKLFEVLRRVQTLSNYKIGDDLSGFHSVVVSLLSYVEELVEKLPTTLGLKELAVKALGFFKNGSSHVLLREIRTVVDRFKTDGKCLLAIGFRERITVLQSKLSHDLVITEWAQRSLALRQLLLEWNRVCKISDSYSTTAREEPACYVFEGPPGRLKSVVVNGLLQAMGETVYTHSIKAIHDGKDWHDNYNNEVNYVMDDVGQQGVSQWRTVINFVSAVKMPLECAEARLKDSKFFNSKRIILTTNRFQTLHGLKDTDCISDITALWRRGYVFDFSQVQRVRGFLVGTMQFKYFDLASKTFVCAFPPEVAAELKDISSSLTLSVDSPRTDLFSWMMKIIRKIDLVKERHVFDNGLSESELDLIRQEVNSFTGEGLFDFWTSGKTSTVFDAGDLPLDAGSVWTLEGIAHCVGECFGTLAKAIVSLDFSSILKIMTVIILVIGLVLLRQHWLTNGYGSITFECAFVGEAGHFKYSAETLHNSVTSLVSRVKPICIRVEGRDQFCFSLVSGHNLIVPAHLVFGSVDCVSLFGDVKGLNVIVDKEKATLVYKDLENDVAILRLPATFAAPFRKMSEYVKDGVSAEDELYLVNQMGVKALGCYANCQIKETTPYTVVANGFVGHIKPYYAAYDVRGAGLCGSILYSVKGGIVGMHVAGGGDNVGVSSVWSLSVRNNIKKFLTDDAYVLPYPDRIDDLKTENMSVCRLDAVVNATVPSKTAYGESPLFGIFPVTREPADLTKFGRCTVKDIAKKSFQLSPVLDSQELEYGKKVVASLLDSFGDLPVDEIVGGNEWLAGLNKDSSNGYKCDKEKSTYVDFPNRALTPLCEDELRQLEVALASGEDVDWEKLFWVETLKDELRGFEKEGVPRSFRIGTIHQQILTKKFFGRMVEHIVKGRRWNHVMVGTNPNADWPWIYQTLMRSKGVFAGDVKSWDGSMSCQVQRAIVDTIMCFYEGPTPLVAGRVLDLLVHSLVVVQDDLYYTTHSMPSGSFLTAIVNSLVNRFYTAMWYYRCMTNAKRKVTVAGLMEDVVDFVYGDDKLNAIRRHEDILHAISMRDFFDSIGLGFTTSTKQVVEKPFEDVADVTFLKRAFRYHNELKKVVGPLDLRTLFSFLSYVNYDKDIDQVMLDKVNCFQREIFLHVNRQELLTRLQVGLAEKQFDFVELPKSYLKALYSDETYNPDSYRLGFKDVRI